MQNKKIAQSELEVLLGREHKSLAGLAFSPMDSFWQLDFSSGRLVNVKRALESLDESVHAYFRLALARFAGSRKNHSVSNLCDHIVLVASRHEGEFNLLDESDFLSAKVKAGKEREYQLSTIRGFLRFWHQSGLYGVSDQLIEAIGGLTFSGNEKGRSVLSNDPLSGPYTQLEMEAIIDGLNNAFLEGRISLEEWVLVKVFAERGLRRAQIVQLAFEDFSVVAGGYVIDQPRAKQRGLGFREVFSRYPVSEDLYKAIQLLKAERIREIEGMVSGVSAKSLNLLPLFPVLEFVVDHAVHGRNVSAECFQNVERITRMMNCVEKKIEAFSERTGERIKLSSGRFRAAMGTDLAREGAGVGVIASALDHTDHQNAGVYVQSTGDTATRLNHKIGKMLAPLAQAFAGMVVRNESEAARSGDPTSRIRSMDGTENIGSCGNHSFCSAYAPVACYTCVKFQPWADAPHEDVLMGLYEERERTLKATGDETMARILDRSILAVEEVIQRCEDFLGKEGACDE